MTTGNKNVTVEEVDDEDAEGFEDEDEIDDEWLEELENVVDGEEVDEDEEFEPGDTLGKILAFINQVCTCSLSMYSIVF